AFLSRAGDAATTNTWLSIALALISKEIFENFTLPAKLGQVDLVLHPKDTRVVLIKLLEAIFEKREPKIPRKHGNMPL
ncbi:hypothetical protein H5T58_02390, partial [Candidatus Parcubacteria bacterium]|nr:hypothetical protein [Candidatus Parcubacteria bacterium]